MRVQHDRLLALVRAARHPDRPARRSAPRASAAQRLDAWRRLEVELDVAGDQRAIRRRRSSGTARASASLCAAMTMPFDSAWRNSDISRRYLPTERGDTRALASTSGTALPAAFAVEVRPQFGLQDDREPRLDPVEEAPDRARQVERHVAQQHVVAEQLPRPRGARRRHGGQQQPVCRVTPMQLVDERSCRLHLADRHGMHPDHRAGNGGAEAEPLAEPAAVARVAHLRQSCTTIATGAAK